MLKGYRPIFNVVLQGKSAHKILWATILSFTFSIAVILCTFGLMDGFDHLLKSGLRHSSGDILLNHRRGFFALDDHLVEKIIAVAPRSMAPVIQTEAFALSDGNSKGVLVRGIEPLNFSKTTGLKLNLGTDEVVVGAELAKQFHLKVGSEMALTLGKGNETLNSLPTVKVFRVSQIVTHGIYQKDLRFVYLLRQDLATLLNVDDKVNLVILSIEDASVPLGNLEVVESARLRLRQELDHEYLVRPFWSEYSFLLEAVKVEKFSISLILQLIVVIAVFNIMAFVIYIMERKAQDFFFLRAVGVSLRSLMGFWFLSIVGMWIVSCVGAYFLSHVFDYGLHHLPFLQIPGEIYVLSSLSIKLNLKSYLTVYALSFCWVLLAALIGYLRLRNRPIIQGLRQEFN